MSLEMPSVEDLNNEPSGEEAGSTGAPAAAPVTPVSTTPAAPSADDLFDVKVDGKLYKVPRSEVIAGYQRQQDYTRKTMGLSEERRAWEAEKAEIMSQVQELREWLQNPINLRNYLSQLSQQQGYEDPDMPVTAAQAQKMVEARLEQERQNQQKQAQTQEQEIMTKVQATAYLNEINATIKGLLDTYPELKTVDGIDALLYRDVATMDPQSLDEAKQGFAKAAEARSNKIRAHFNELRKQSAASSNKLSQGIEPPGSAGVPTAPQPKFQLGSKDLVNQVIADLMGAGK